MKKILCFGLMLVLLLTLPLGCKKKTAELKTVELHEVTRSVFYAPQYVALNLGYFEAEGLNVNITTSGGSDKAMTALLSVSSTKATRSFCCKTSSFRPSLAPWRYSVRRPSARA